MDKLIIKIPAFNKEAVKQGMFIQVTHFGNTDKMKAVTVNGIISKVEDNRIIYLTDNGSHKTIHATSIVEGTSTLKIAADLAEPKKSAVEHIVKEVSTGTSVGYTCLNITTNNDNISVAGMRYSDVFVDGVRYVQAPTAYPHYTTDCAK